MSLLPSELLSKIFLHLDQYDKVNCMLVCQDWKNTIKEFALYHTLCFYTVSSFETFTEKIQEQPEIGKKVKQLIIKVESRDSGNHINLTPLFLLLPNLQTLLLSRHHNVAIMLENQVSYPFHKHIKHMHVDSLEHDLCQSIAFGKYPNLKSLVMNLDVVIPQLQHFAALTRLELRNVQVTSSKLEEIHDCAPYLESLLITSGDFSDLRREYKDIIMPASSVTTFVLSMQSMQPDNARTKRNMLNYIYRKYPALTSLTFKFAVPWEVHQHYHHSSHRDGWMPLLYQLGPQLKRVAIDHDCHIDRPFEAFDQAGCQLEYFRIGYFPVTLFAGMMMPSQQLRSLQTLVLDLPLNMNVPGFGWLKHLMVLKKLKFSGPKTSSLKFNKILENCPQFLKVLSFQSIILKWTDTYLEPCHQIETLSLDVSPIADGFDAFISRCLPRLSKLKLKKCGLLEKSFDVKGMDLTYFYFTDQFIKWKNGIMVWTMCNQERRWHIVTKNDFERTGPIHSKTNFCGPPYVPMSIHPPSRFRIWPEFTFYCHSVNKVILSE